MKLKLPTLLCALAICVAGAAAQLLVATIQCQRKLAAAALKGVPFDDVACEDKARAKLAAVPVAACPCVDPASIARAFTRFLGDTNDLLYCAGTQRF